MLWYKTWLETRLWFFLAVTLLSAQVIAMYVAYPMDPVTSYPNGALGVLPQEMARLRTPEFTGYAWVRWFSTTMLLIWPVFVVQLAGTGLESSAGREYLLSLPVTRRRVVLERLAVVGTQIVLFTIVPTLLLCAMAPLRGVYYPWTDALVQCVLLLLSGTALFGLVMFLRAVTNQAAAYVAAGALLVLCGMFTFVATGFTPYSIFRLMNGAEYFFNGRIPWTGLALSVGFGVGLAWLSLRIAERRDY